MIDTKAFKTGCEILERKMPRINGNNQYKGKTIVAMDIGYSAVKGVSPNKIFKFPSYAKRAPKGLEVIGKVRAADIQFMDNTTGTIWLVGQAAEALMEQSDVDSTTDASLYTRYRYDSDMFKVLAGTGLALGLMGTGADNEIYLQTGLPATYKERDTNKLVQALVGSYDISIKVGNGTWNSFQFTLSEDHINVMEQPQGTLCAAAYAADGNYSIIGKDIMTSNSIIYDIGFGTEDIFSIKKGYKNDHQTYSDTGMKAVFDAVIKEIDNKTDGGAAFKIFEFQNYLESGKASYFNRDEMKMEEIDFADILEEKNAELCKKSIGRLLQDYDNLLKYKYLIVTGGTGESRFKQIQEMLSGISSLTVLPGNLNNDDLSFSYSNVIGYYMFRHGALQREIRNTVNN